MKKSLKTILIKREHKFWVEKYQNIYNTFNYAIKLYFGINNSNQRLQVLKMDK